MIRPSTLLLSSQQFERNQLCMLLAPPCGGAPQLLSLLTTTSSSTTTTIHQRSAHIGASAAAPHAQPMNYLRQHTVRVFQFGLLVRVFLHKSHTLGMTRLPTSGCKVSLVINNVRNVQRNLEAIHIGDGHAGHQYFRNIVQLESEILSHNIQELFIWFQQQNLHKNQQILLCVCQPNE